MSMPDSGSGWAELEEAAASGSGAAAAGITEGEAEAWEGVLGELGVEVEARGAAVAKVAALGGAQGCMQEDHPRAHVRCWWSCCPLQLHVSWLLPGFAQVPMCCLKASACERGVTSFLVAGSPAVPGPGVPVCFVQRREALAITYRVTR